MKRFFAIILCVLSLCAVLTLASCDYQESIDSVRADMMDTAKDLLDPFLNEAEESTVDSSGTDASVDNAEI